MPTARQSGRSAEQMGPPLDLNVLAAQTGGVDELAREVLRLFADEAPTEVARLAAASPQERRQIAHRLVGGARAIGAAEVARLAAKVEMGAGDIAALQAATAIACRFINDYLRSK